MAKKPPGEGKGREGKGRKIRVCMYQEERSSESSRRREQEEGKKGGFCARNQISRTELAAERGGRDRGPGRA